MNKIEYIEELEDSLPKELFTNNPKRIFWFFFHWLCISLMCFLIIVVHQPMLSFVASMLLGHSLGCLMLFAHEIIHRSVFRNSFFVHFFGTLSAFQFGITSYVWQEWHNKYHHRYTQVPGKDPDCWGIEGYYRCDKYVRLVHKIAPGSGHFLSLFYLFVFFMLKCALIIFVNNKIFQSKSLRMFNQVFFVIWYFCWISLSIFFGYFVTLFLIPFFMMNFIMMMYICTNHFISQATPKENDAILNTLTVTVPRWMELLHCNINYHTEHHLFPAANPNYYSQVSSLLEKKYKDKYKKIPLFKALCLVYKTPRMYRENDLLVNPETGYTAKTLN